MASETPKGKELNVIVSEYPIYLDSVQTGEVSEGRYALSFRQLLPLKGWIDIQIDAERFFGPGGVSALAGKGANIRERDAFRTYVVLSIDAYHRAKMTSVAYDQCGWKDGHTFLLGKLLYTPQGTRVVSGSPEIEYRAKFLRPMPGGSLPAWTNATKLFAGAGGEPLAFGIMAGFASPFMYFHGLGEGGTILSLVSRSSAMGKTSTVDAVSSIWGQSEGTKMIISDTKVGKGLLQASLKHVSIIFDEAEYTDAAALKDFVMTFSTGRDKLRGTQDGGLKQGQSWQTIMVCAGNKSMVESLAFSSGSDAQAYRVMEIQASIGDGIGKKEADDLMAQLRRNAGWAGDAFLRYIVQPDIVRFVTEALPKWTDDIWQKTGLSREYRFWVRMLGCMAVAAPIVEKLGLVAFNPQRIVDWGIAEAARLGGTKLRDMTSIGTLSDYLTTYSRNLIIVRHAYKSGVMQQMEYQPQSPLVGRWERDEGRLYLLEGPLVNWMVKGGLSKRGFVQELTANGVLIVEKKLSTITAGTGLLSGQAPCMIFNTNHQQFSGALAPVMEEVARHPAGKPVQLKQRGIR